MCISNEEFVIKVLFDSHSFLNPTRRLLRRVHSACQTKMGTRPGRAVTREFIGGGVHSLISVLSN